MLTPPGKNRTMAPRRSFCSSRWWLNQEEISNSGNITAMSGAVFRETVMQENPLYLVVALNRDSTFCVKREVFLKISMDSKVFLDIS